MAFSQLSTVMGAFETLVYAIRILAHPVIFAVSPESLLSSMSLYSSIRIQHNNNNSLHSHLHIQRAFRTKY